MFQPLSPFLDDTALHIHLLLNHFHGSFTTMIVFIAPPLLHLKSNVEGMLICVVACIGTAILWYFRHGDKILFIIGISLVFNVYQLQWGASNAMISSFVHKSDKEKSHKYLSALSASWTIATFLFIAVGFILKYESFWSYLEWMLIAFSILAVLNMVLLPRESVNKYNAIYHNQSQFTHDEDLQISLSQDLKILFGITEYRIIIFTASLAFLAWSWYYTSFGYWIQRLYGLNQAELGIAAALIEGVGNSIAILVITYLVQNEEDDTNWRLSPWRMRLEVMMIYFGILLLVSLLGMVLINYTDFFMFLLEYKLIVYMLICGYFCGSEGVIVGAMILSVTETPPAQQARSSAIVSITNSVCLFIGQFTVGMVYEKGGFRFETPFLLIFMIAILSSTIYLAYIMKKKKLNEELIWINKHSYPKYT